MTTILYIPGLGDRYDPARRFALKFWRVWGVRAQLIPITWYDGKSMNEKVGRIEAAIASVDTKDRIVLIGESAGATLALHVGCEDQRVSRIITLCGVARSTTPIAGYLRKKAPALDTGVNTLRPNKKADIHSVRAYLDPTVGKKYSVAPGAAEHIVWSIGHLTTIALCLTIYAPYLVAIAKKQK